MINSATSGNELTPAPDFAFAHPGYGTSIFKQPRRPSLRANAKQSSAGLRTATLDRAAAFELDTTAIAVDNPRRQTRHRKVCT
jgi:hypothetical protein